jgi:hypothetical protein
MTTIYNNKQVKFENFISAYRIIHNLFVEDSRHNGFNVTFALLLLEDGGDLYSDYTDILNKTNVTSLESFAEEIFNQ